MVEKYRVVFKGEISPHENLLEVRKKLAQLYKISVEETDRFFSGKWFVLKDNTDLETARRFTIQFEQRTGARCSMVKIEQPQQPVSTQQQSAVTTENKTPDPQNKPLPRYETTYRLMFNGELLIDKDINEVKTNLSILYKVKPEKIERFFSGKPVIIIDSADFWTATGYLKRFKDCGAVCYLEVVEPSGKVIPVPENTTQKQGLISSVPSINKETNQVSPAPVRHQNQVIAVAPVGGAAPVVALSEHELEVDQIKLQSRPLYDLLTKTYKQVQLEYRIERKLKEFQRGETTLGCLFLFVIGAAIALVIWSPLRWYWGLLGTIGIMAIFTPFSKTWDTKYAAAFLKRMDYEKQKNFPLYAATLNKWIHDLAPEDRAKKFFHDEMQKLLNENTRYEDDYQKYSRMIGMVEEPVEQSQVTDKTGEKRAKKEVILCPRCGSTWVSETTKGFSWGKGIIASAFLGPLGGAIVGSIGEGKPIYFCESCRKKWSRS